jgi:hypothetical protein
MKSLISVVAVIGLLTTGTIAAQSASSSKSGRENDTTMQLNQEQLQSNAQQAATPPEDAPTPMPQPQAGTVINGKFVPAGARCGNDNPSCAQQIGNPAVNSATQLRLQGAQ